MKDFGYLSESGPNTGSLLSEEAVTEALVSLQTFGGVPATGVLDNSTIKVNLWNLFIQYFNFLASFFCHHAVEIKMLEVTKGDPGQGVLQKYIQSLKGNTQHIKWVEIFILLQKKNKKIHHWIWGLEKKKTDLSVIETLITNFIVSKFIL